jgi:hypothetical protein
MLTISRLQELIFEYGGFIWDEDLMDPDEMIHGLQAEAEYHCSEAISDGEMTVEQSEILLTELSDRYGYPYPVRLPGGDNPRL